MSTSFLFHPSGSIAATVRSPRGGELAFFEMNGAIVGCAIVREAPREMTETEKDDYGEDTGEDWKAIMTLDTSTIWIWTSKQDVGLKEAGIDQFLPGPPMHLTVRNVLSIFKAVARKSDF